MATDRAGDVPAGPPYLIHTFEHRAYPLPQLTQGRPLIIGRDIGSDIVVNEVSVSRRHAEVHGDGGTYAVHAIGSTPTLVNDTAVVTPHVLQEGDTILVGTMKFIFTYERLPVAMAVAPAQAPRMLSSIDDRRPTLTFTRQGPATTPPSKKWGVVLVTILIVLVVVAYVLSRAL